MIIKKSIESLKPGFTYYVQAKNIDSGQWSESYKIDIPKDATPPPNPSSLNLNFDGPSLIVKWDGSASKSAKDFLDFEIVIGTPSSAQTRIFYTADEALEFTFDENVKTFGIAKSTLTVSIRARDTSKNFSSVLLTGTATNASPTTPGGTLIANGGLQSYIIDLSGLSGKPSDYANTKINIYSNESGGSAVHTWTGTDSIATIRTTNYTQRWVTARYVDIFGQQGPEIATRVPVTALNPVIIDTNAPSAPIVNTSLTAWSGTTFNVVFTKSSAPDVAYYLIDISNGSVTKTFNFNAAGDGNQTFVFDIVQHLAAFGAGFKTLSATVRAVDAVGNISSSSNSSGNKTASAVTFSGTSTLIAGNYNYTVDWTSQSAVSGYSHTRVYDHLESFTDPEIGTLKWSGSDGPAIISATSTRHVRVFHYSVFNDVTMITPTPSSITPIDPVQNALDTTAPGDVTSVTRTFTDGKYEITFTKPADTDLKDFVIDLTAGITIRRVIQDVTSDSTQTYTLSLQSNIALFGSAQKTISASIRTRDRLGNLQTTGVGVTSITASDQTVAPSGIVTQAQNKSYSVSWTKPTFSTYAYSEIKEGATVVWSGTDTSATINTADFASRIPTVVHYDFFGNSKSTNGSPVTPINPTPVDSLAPKPPTAATTPTEFSDTTFIFRFIKPTQNTDNSTLTDLKDFVVSLTANSQTKSFIVTPQTPSEQVFTLSLAENIANWGTAQVAITSASVVARDNINNTSTAYTYSTATTATDNTIIPQNVAVTPNNNGYSVTWTRPTFAGYSYSEILESPTSGSGYVSIWNGTSNLNEITTRNFNTRYVVVRHYDVFNRSKQSAEITTQPISSVLINANAPIIGSGQLIASNASKPVTQYSISGTTATITSTSHDFVAGDTIVLSGIAPYVDGTKTVLAGPLTNSFTVTVSALAGNVANTTVAGNATRIVESKDNKVLISSTGIKGSTGSTVNFELNQSGILTAKGANIEGTITAGGLDVGSLGNVRGGATTYASGTGFFLGYDSTTHKFRAGNPSGQRITWDGTNLSVVGQITVESGSNVLTTTEVQNTYATQTTVSNLDTSVTNVKNKSTQTIAQEGLISGTTITGGGITLSNGGSIKSAGISYNSGTGFFLGYDSTAYKFFVGNSSANKMIWDGTSLSITGQITSTTGTIGGWTLGTNTLSAGSAGSTVGLSSIATAGNIAIWAGANNPADALFKVTNTGVLTATGATITGTVTATSGAIGGITLGSNQIYSGTGNFNNADTPFFAGSDGKFSLGNQLSWSGTALSVKGNITLDGGSLIGGNVSLGASGSLYAGANPTSGQRLILNSSGIAGYDSSGISKFSVTTAGAVTATSGTIGGWTLGDTTLSSNNVSLSNTGVITAGTGNSIVTISSVDSTYRLWAGNTSGASANFSVKSDGTLTATDANITGAITATSGSFTGAITAQSGSIAGNMYLGGGLLATPFYLITNFSRTSGGVVTLTFAANPSALVVGQSVHVEGLPFYVNSLNGTFSVTAKSSVSPWTISYNSGGGAISSTAVVGTARAYASNTNNAVALTSSGITGTQNGNTTFQLVNSSTGINKIGGWEFDSTKLYGKTADARTFNATFGENPDDSAQLFWNASYYDIWPWQNYQEMQITSSPAPIIYTGEELTFNYTPPGKSASSYIYEVIGKVLNNSGIPVPNKYFVLLKSNQLNFAIGPVNNISVSANFHGLSSQEDSTIVLGASGSSLTDGSFTIDGSGLSIADARISGNTYNKYNSNFRSVFVNGEIFGIAPEKSPTSRNAPGAAVFAVTQNQGGSESRLDLFADGLQRVARYQERLSNIVRLYFVINPSNPGQAKYHNFKVGDSINITRVQTTTNNIFSNVTTTATVSAADNYSISLLGFGGADVPQQNTFLLISSAQSGAQNKSVLTLSNRVPNDSIYMDNLNINMTNFNGDALNMTAQGISSNGVTLIENGAFKSYACLLNKASQSIPNNTNTFMFFDNEVSDPHEWHSQTTNPQRITPNRPGYYHVTGSYIFPVNATGGRIVAIRKNGVELVKDWEAPQGLLEVYINISTYVYLNGTTDYVDTAVLQTSGGALNCSCNFTAVWIGNQ